MMKKIEPKDLTPNVFDLIGKDWMLITAGTGSHFNTMTANWGGMGYLWHRPVVFVFVRPERYTFEFMERYDEFTLSFLRNEYRSALTICGTTSGRTTDKVETAGLTPVVTSRENILFEEMKIGVECRKIYAGSMSPDHFSDPSILEKWYDTEGGIHKMYIGEIVQVFTKE